ncbi:MAG: DNA polymerase III subunit gamma/tau, partial [Candidatus Omnitrophica bacterium]|nr:DNA polymerase III subunit gamma/tau [Candidatus Omnitrophota bacterium]
VFALKWRPQNFDEIVGQNHIVLTLKSALQKGRLAHAYLFAGPRGVGKTSTARILAKALNCKNGPTIEPCGKCASCLEIAQSRSLDVIEIDGASNTGVDDVRALRENVKFSPTTGKFKIYIIDEVHMLSTAAFNALLKTLEEPPDFVKFIFATTHPDKIPSTVLSRCQRLDFRRVTLMEIVKQLEKITAAENIKVDKEVLFTIAKASDGALRDAESILDQLAVFSKAAISLKDVLSVLGLVEQEMLFEITEKIIQKDSLGALKLLNDLIDQGKDISIFLNNLIEHFRNLMVAKITKADQKLIDLPQEACDKLLKQSQSFSLEELFITFNTLVNTQEMSKRLESLRIPLEVTLVKLCHDKKEGSAHYTAPKQQPPAEKKIHHAPIANEEIKKTAEPEPPAQEDTKNISLEAVRAVWANIIETLSKVKMSVATYLNEGALVKIEKNILTIAFPKNYSLHKESLETRENRAMIERTVSELSNCNLKVNFILSQEAASKDAEDDTFLKSALEAFGGRVIRKDE